MVSCKLACVGSLHSSAAAAVSLGSFLQVTIATRRIVASPPPSIGLVKSSSNDSLVNLLHEDHQHDRCLLSSSNPNVNMVKPKKEQPRLIHPSLHQIPMQARFGLAGLLSNVIFMVLYNVSVAKFEHLYAASAIYSVVYFFFIPISHALSSGIVFGWPKKYFPNLISNYPIGLTAIAIGAACTAYLDRIGFNEMVEDMIRSWSWSTLEKVATDEDEKGEFYSSLLVLVITSVWSYVLSVMINTPSEAADHEKEL